MRRLQAAVRRGAPREAELAAAYLQKARESGDPSFYSRADGVLSRALARGPADPAELTEAAALAAGRHDFRDAERLARRARALAPDSIGAFAVQVDALVELGRYRDAERTLQRMVDLKPNLPSYARVSYFRELTGDLTGAAQALRARDRRRRPRARERRLRPEPARLARAQPRPARRTRGARTPRRWRPCPATRPPRPDAPGWRRARGDLRGRDRGAGASWSRGCRCPSTSSALGEAELAAAAEPATRRAPRACAPRGGATSRSSARRSGCWRPPA